MNARQVAFDAEELVSPETFALIQRYYWVSAYRNGDEPFWWDWVFSLTQPRQVPNKSMEWRRPTYQEACTREWWFRNDREHWDRCITDYGGRLRSYCEQQPLPSAYTRDEKESP